MKFLYSNDVIGVLPLSEKELEGEYIHWFNDLEVCAHNRHGVFPMSISQIKNFISSLATDKSQIVWAVYHLPDKKHIGNISLQSISLLDRTAEVAFLFGEKHYWGKGYAFSAASWIIEHGFNQLNLNRIYCGTASTNLAMQKLAEKLGMLKEGCRRQALYLNGDYADIIEFGLLRSEWKA